MYKFTYYNIDIIIFILIVALADVVLCLDYYYNRKVSYLKITGLALILWSNTVLKNIMNPTF